MASVKSLDPVVRARVRSGFAIPSFSQCVEELVTNSIDAKASHIICEYNAENLYCKVSDDGIGFTEEGICKAGTRYSTSKCSTLRDVHGNLWYYGYRGEALASIAELARELEIVSRRHHTKIQYTKKIVSPAQENRISATTSQKCLPAETRVSFRGLFYDLPVRRLGINQTLEAENIVTRIKCLSIVNPKISFSVVNASVSKLDFHISKHEHSLESDVRFAVEGAFSTIGHESQALQFVYINGRVVMKTRIHSEINSLIKKSEISRRLVSVDRATSPEKNNEKPSVKKTCGYDEYDITFEPEKTFVEFRDWDCVLNCVLNVVSDFLKENRLLRCVISDETHIKSLITTRSKVTHSGFARDLLTDNCVMGNFAYGDVNPECRRPPQEGPTEDIANTSTFENKDTPTEQKLHSNWTSVFDAISGKTIFVNLTTGMTANMNPCQDIGRPEYLTSKVHDNAVGPAYVKEFVPRSKKQREMKAVGKNRCGNTYGKQYCHHLQDIAKIDPRALSSLFQSSKTPVVYTKDMFKNIKVIGQVDGKFIACSYDSNPIDFKKAQQKAIILFDQHAAHERIRLERLESKLRKEGKIVSEKMKNKMHIQLKESETLIMNDIKSTFQSHGLDFDNEGSKPGVNILAVPHLFVERTSKIRDENRRGSELESLIQRFVRDEIQVYRETGRGSSIIPRCLFEILCSQACHGAIRFGDSLSSEECRKIISDLSNCQLPFQCAHGRPSMTSVFYNISQPAGRPNLTRITASSVHR